jgi:hypothetical protein
MALFIWQIVSILSSGHHQVIKQEPETYAETKNITYDPSLGLKLVDIKIKLFTGEFAGVVNIYGYRTEIFLIGEWLK